MEPARRKKITVIAIILMLSLVLGPVGFYSYGEKETARVGEGPQPGFITEALSDSLSALLTVNFAFASHRDRLKKACRWIERATGGKPPYCKFDAPAPSGPWLPFGGRVAKGAPCCNGVAFTLQQPPVQGPPGDDLIFIAPWYALRREFLPYPFAWVLGLYRQNGYCEVPILLCLPVPVDFTVDIIGTSFPGI